MKVPNRFFAVPVLLFVLQLVASGGEIVTSELEYKVGDKVMRGYLARPVGSTTNLAAVAVVHEWWGHNEFVRGRADDLARQGYVAFSVDMYGDGKVAAHPTEAGEFAKEVNENLYAARGRFEQALALLREQPGVDPARIGALGYCFGGGLLLNLAREGLDVAALASVHGPLRGAHHAEKGKVKPRILVCHGEADAVVSAQDVYSFKKEMEWAGANFTFISYSGAGHAFSNPEADALAEKFGLPIAYDHEAAEKSWEDVLIFMEETLRRAGEG